MTQHQADTPGEPPVNVIGRRLTVLGALGALVAGVIWLAQKSGHDGGQAILSAVRDPEPFNGTPYAIALAVAVGVLALGLVLSKTGRR